MLSSQSNELSTNIFSAPFRIAVFVAIVAAFLLILLSNQNPTNSNSQKLQKYEDLNVIAIRAQEGFADALEIDSSLRTHQSAQELGLSSVSKPVNHTYWFKIYIPSNPKNSVIEIPSLRLVDANKARFWRVLNNNQGEDLFIPIATSEAIDPKLSRAGYSFKIDATDRQSLIIGEITSPTPNGLEARQWTQDDYAQEKSNFDKLGGALFGGIIALSVFSALLAIVNRESIFFLFSGLLLTSLRIAAINAGWDKFWLNSSISDEVYATVLRLSICAFGLFNLALFHKINSNQTRSIAAKTITRSLNFGFWCLLFAAPFIDHYVFLSIFWPYAICALLTLTSQIFFTFISNSNKSSLWLAISWVAVLIGMGSELTAQSGIFTPIHWLNSQFATILSALFAGLVVSNYLTEEKDKRISAQHQSLIHLEKYKRIFNSSPVGLFGINSLGEIKFFNSNFADLLFLSDQSKSGPLFIESLLGNNSLSKIQVACLTPGLPLELSVHQEQQSTRWFLLRLSRNIDLIEGSIQDITQKKHAELELRNLVDHDHLTGLLNRRGLENRLRAASADVGAGLDHSIAYLDIDRFKLVNDLHGFGVGDALLQQVGRRIDALSRGRDSVARVADSFVIVLQDCSVSAALHALERVREAICAEAFEIDGKVLNVTVSIGIVALDPASSDYVDVMAAAGRACSEAKARGRNCVVQLSEQDSMLQSHLHELRVVANLQQKIPTDRYFLELQPIVSLSAPDSSLSYEVLIRMRDEDGSVVPPSRFIGAAERHGLMSQIDRWVLRNTLEWLDANPEHRDRINFATLNLSGASLNDRRFVDDAFAMIEEHRVSASKLCFEITESVALHDVGSTRRFADRIRQSGSMLALDDFGAGYTSFNYLKEIPADFIKIDGSFVKDINLNPANYAITRTIVDLTHELGMRSIAEWAETHDTVASLIDLRVDFAQGFGLVRPVCPDLVLGAHSCGSLMTDPKVIALLSAGTSRTGQTVL